MSRPLRFWKISAVAALAVLLVFQAGGWFLASGILQFQAKTAAHFALYRRDTPLETVTLAAAFLSKIRVGKKEIRLEGRLYDIKNQEVRGDSIVLVLYRDKHEEAILGAVGDLFSPGCGPNAALPLQNWLAQWLGAAFLMPPAAPEIRCCRRVFSLPSFLFLPRPAQHTPGCFSPPPELDVVRHSLRVTA